MSTPLIEKMSVDIDDLKNNMITETAEGTSIDITDSANARIRDLKIFGTIEQDGTPTPSEPVEIQTVSGDVAVTLSNGEAEKVVELNLGDLELCENEYIYKSKNKYYIHKIWQKLVLDETYSWNLETSNGAHNFSLKTGITNTAETILCNYFKYHNIAWVYDYNRIYIEDVGKINVTLASDDDNYCETLEEFLSWISENNLVVYFCSIEATDEEITDETLIKQLDKLYNLKTYQTTTSISTETDNLEPILSVTYVIDLKTYIDNKISEIST